MEAVIRLNSVEPIVAPKQLIQCVYVRGNTNGPRDHAVYRAEWHNTPTPMGSNWKTVFSKFTIITHDPVRLISLLIHDRQLVSPGIVERFGGYDVAPGRSSFTILIPVEANDTAGVSVVSEIEMFTGVAPQNEMFLELLGHYKE